MTTNGNWLERLDAATEYRDLQAIFSELVKEVQAATNGPQLAESIDEAIRRIEQERARDQNELAMHEQEYAAFKNQQSGITGWFKRHLPFTETRRMDRQHRDSVADQHAEILADNLFIARAQMLKQRLLPPEFRRLGKRPDQWRNSLSNSESIDRLQSYGTVIVSLSQELTNSEQFTQAIRVEINAFRDAAFASDESRQSQKSDIKAATEELKTLEIEIKDERGLLEAAVQRAGMLVSEELSLHDSAYYLVMQRVDHLKVATELAKRSADTASGLTDMLSTLGKQSEQADKLDRDQTDLVVRGEQVKNDLQSAKARLTPAEQQCVSMAVHYDESKRRADQAEAGLSAASKIYEQHRASSAGDASNSINPSNPVFAEYQKLEQDRAAATDALRIASAPFDLAKSYRDEVKQSVNKLEADLRSIDSAKNELSRQQQNTANTCNILRDKIPMAIGEFEPLLDEYFGALEPLEWESHVMKLNRTLQWKNALSSSFDQPRHDWRNVSTPSSFNASETERLFQSVTEAIKKDQQELKRQLEADEKRRKDSWTRRCHELIGSEAARLVCGI